MRAGALSRRQLLQRSLGLAGLTLAAGCLVPRPGATPSTKTPRIGIFFLASREQVAGFLDAFRQGLHDHGYVEGVNVALEDRYADGVEDRLPGLAAELPIEQLTKLELVVNLKTAQALGLTISGSPLLVAPTHASGFRAMALAKPMKPKNAPMSTRRRASAFRAAARWSPMRPDAASLSTARSTRVSMYSGCEGAR